MKTYVALPITGVAEANLPLARKVQRFLEARGHTVVVPHDVPAAQHTGPCPEADTYPGATVLDGQQPHGGLCHLRADLVAMLQCELVVACPGWSRSRGASLEVRTACGVGIPVSFYGEDELGPFVSSDPEAYHDS